MDWMFCRTDRGMSSTFSSTGCPVFGLFFVYSLGSLFEVEEILPNTLCTHAVF